MHTRTLAGRLAPALAGGTALLGALCAGPAHAQTGPPCTAERDGATMVVTCNRGPISDNELIRAINPSAMPRTVTLPMGVTELVVRVSGTITKSGFPPAVDVRSDGAIRIQSAASVSATGSDVHALYAQSTHGHSVRIENLIGGVASATGSNAYGMFADLCQALGPMSTCPSDTSRADVAALNLGTVSVGGDGSAGIRAVASGNARSVTAENRGFVSVTSGEATSTPGFIDGIPAGLTAIVGGTGSAAPVNVVNSGKVTVIPPVGYGLHGRHEGSGVITIRNENGGTVDADIAVKVVGGARMSLMNEGNSVTNEGTLRGRFEFGDGDETFVNSGLFEMASGTSAAGGGGDEFRNEGILHLGKGDTPQIDDVTVSGLEKFTQTAAGTLSMDLFLDVAGSSCSDTLDLGGADATFDGTLAIGGLKLSHYAPADRTCNLVTVSGTSTITVEDGFLAGSRETVAARLEPGLAVGGTVIEVVASLNYAPEGLLPNRRAVGEYLNGVGRLDPGDATTHVLHPMTQIRRTAAYARALDELSPEAYDAPLRDSLRAAGDLLHDLLEERCPEGGEDAELPKENCIWAGAEYRQHTRKREDEHPRFRETTYGLRGYLERPARSEWLYRFAASIEQADTRTDTAADIDGHRLMVGALAEKGPPDRRTRFGAVLGIEDRDVERRFPTLDGHARPGDRLGAARGSPSVLFGSLHAGIGTRRDRGDLRFLPAVAARLGFARMPGVTEGGGGGALEIGSLSDTVLSLHPRISVESDIVRDEYNLIRPRFTLAYAYRSGAPEALRARFANRMGTAVDTTGAGWFSVERGERRGSLDGILETLFRSGSSDLRAGVAFGTSTGGDTGIAAFFEGMVRF